MSMLLQQTAQYHPEEKETHMLEFHTPERLEALEAPRVFNTHMRPNNMPEQFSQKRCKTVFVQRNPKDVAVSFYYHSKDKIKFTGTFLQFVEFFITENGPGKVILSTIHFILKYLLELEYQSRLTFSRDLLKYPIILNFLF